MSFPAVVTNECDVQKLVERPRGEYFRQIRFIAYFSQADSSSTTFTYGSAHDNHVLPETAKPYSYREVLNSVCSRSARIGPRNAAAPEFLYYRFATPDGVKQVPFDEHVLHWLCRPRCVRLEDRPHEARLNVCQGALVVVRPGRVEPLTLSAGQLLRQAQNIPKTLRRARGGMELEYEVAKTGPRSAARKIRTKFPFTNTPLAFEMHGVEWSYDFSKGVFGFKSMIAERLYSEFGFELGDTYAVDALYGYGSPAVYERLTENVLSRMFSYGNSIARLSRCHAWDGDELLIVLIPKSSQTSGNCECPPPRPEHEARTSALSPPLSAHGLSDCITLVDSWGTSDLEPGYHMYSWKLSSTSNIDSVLTHAKLSVKALQCMRLHSWSVSKQDDAGLFVVQAKLASTERLSAALGLFKLSTGTDGIAFGPYLVCSPAQCSPGFEPGYEIIDAAELRR